MADSHLAFRTTFLLCYPEGVERSEKRCHNGEVDDTIYDEEYGLYEPEEFRELENAAALGRTVTVSAKVNRIIEPAKAFLTGDDAIDSELLVVVTPKVKDLPMLAEGDDVLVVGKVINFVSSDIETAYEPFDLDTTSTVTSTTTTPSWPRRSSSRPASQARMTSRPEARRAPRRGPLCVRPSCATSLPRGSRTSKDRG